MLSQGITKSAPAMDWNPASKDELRTALEESARVCREAGFDAVLSKPFRKAELSALLEGVLAHAQPKSRVA